MCRSLMSLSAAILATALVGSGQDAEACNLDTLYQDIDAQDLPGEKQLLDKVKAAQNANQQGDTGRAINRLNVVSNEIKGFSHHRLAPAIAADLLSCIESIIDTLGCGGQWRCDYDGDGYTIDGGDSCNNPDELYCAKDILLGDDCVDSDASIHIAPDVYWCDMDGDGHYLQHDNSVDQFCTFPHPSCILYDPNQNDCYDDDPFRICD